MFLLMKMYLCKLVHVLRINKAKQNQRRCQEIKVSPLFPSRVADSQTTHKLAVSLPGDSGE